MTSLISQAGLNELNTFIFVLAIMQVVYSGVTMALGRAKVQRYSFSAIEIFDDYLIIH